MAFWVTYSRCTIRVAAPHLGLQEGNLDVDGTMELQSSEMDAISFLDMTLAMSASLRSLVPQVCGDGNS